MTIHIEGKDATITAISPDAMHLLAKAVNFYLNDEREKARVHSFTANAYNADRPFGALVELDTMLEFFRK